jgi:hypothetical protein
VTVANLPLSRSAEHIYRSGVLRKADVFATSRVQ